MKKLDDYDKMWAGGGAAVIPALWVFGFLLHLMPEPSEHYIVGWWQMPWFVTSMAVGAAIIVCGALAGRKYIK